MFKSTLAALAATLALASAPAAQAASCFSTPVLQAAKLRQLDVMLMVGSLRCRMGADDYRASYDAFLNHHRVELSKANHIVLDGFAGEWGATKANAEMDSMSVAMANKYGQGNGMGCHELKMIAADLADTREETALFEAADTLVGEAILADSCRSTYAMRRR